MKTLAPHVHHWVQLSTTVEGFRRCQCTEGRCRQIVTLTNREFAVLLAAGHVKREVTYPGIGRW